MEDRQIASLTSLPALGDQGRSPSQLELVKALGHPVGLAVSPRSAPVASVPVRTALHTGYVVTV